jgi:hypothetical protein
MPYENYTILVIHHCQVIFIGMAKIVGDIGPSIHFLFFGWNHPGDQYLSLPHLFLPDSYWISAICQKTTQFLIQIQQVKCKLTNINYIKSARIAVVGGGAAPCSPFVSGGAALCSPFVGCRDAPSSPFVGVGVVGVVGRVPRGLYCPPLIPAGIRRNPGDSRNSAGIKFGRGTCQIDKMIPAEFRTEFKFRRNAGITIDGITPERIPRNP